MSISDLPALNASLNGLAAVLLACGWVAIRRRAVAVHKACMISALLTSAVFLACYLVYHYTAKITVWEADGWIRWAYYTVLATHVVLAVIVTPAALVAANHAWRERLEQHKRLARWVMPCWLYVSVTGVLVYWMLYHLHPSLI